MSCSSIWAGVQNGTLFCNPTPAERAEFIQCATQRICASYQAASGVSCNSGDIFFFGLLAALGFQARVQQASCGNQPNPGSFGQPCAPGSPCCPQCLAPLACNGQGNCCPTPMVAGSPCSTSCPCPAPMQCVSGQCQMPCPNPMVEGSPCNAQCPCPQGMVCKDGFCCLQNGWPCDPFSASPAPCKQCPNGSSCQYDGGCFFHYATQDPKTGKIFWDPNLNKVYSPYCPNEARIACNKDPNCKVLPEGSPDGKILCK